MEENSRAAAAERTGGQGQSPFVRNDPGTLAARRCMELGGNELECMGKGLWSGLVDMTGLDLDAMKGPEPAGLVMNGVYKSGSALSVSFGTNGASVSGCGKLESDNHPYTITKKPNQLLINVQNEPSPFVLIMGEDGKLLGPGPTDIKGRIITGYHNVWMQEYRNGIAQAGGSCGGSCGYWTHEPIYAPKTERCAIGVLSAAPPSPPDKTGGGLLGSALNSLAASGLDGLRMTGNYSGQGGLALDFDTDSVILDCGAAHAKQAYTVEKAPTQILVTVKTGASSFTLTLQPDGTLTGSGSADVAGRLVTGSSTNEILYAPKNARCAIGTLTPKGGKASAH